MRYRELIPRVSLIKSGRDYIAGQCLVRLMKIRKIFALGAILATLAMIVPVHLSVTEAKGLIFDWGKEATDESSEKTEREVLWLARAVYSETKNKKSGEMAMIACVIRNRVETKFRGADTFEGVVRAKSQFSGLNPFDRNYARNISLTRDDAVKDENFSNALRISEVIYQTGDLICPTYFPETVRHFYSPVSVTKTPSWAEDEEPFHIIGEQLATARFAFFDGVK